MSDTLFKTDRGVSWRKILTAMVAGLFLYSNLKYLHFGGNTLPESSNVIIAMVFGLYFWKNSPALGGKTADKNVSGEANG